MNFRNVNPLNVRTNLLSGNLLPITPGDSQLSIAWKLYGVFMSLVQVIQVTVLIPGLMMVPREKALVDGTVTSVLSIEVFFNIIWIHTHRKLTSQLIQRMDDILRTEDETMKAIVTKTLQPMNIPLKFYWTAGGLSVVVWGCIPLPLIFEKISFRYEDYRMPAVFSKQPFSVEIYIMGSIFILIGNTYIFLKKSALDIYMIHFVLLLTAQYRYTATKLTAIFRSANLKGELDRASPEVDQQADKEIRKLCRHYAAVLRLSTQLKQLLSLSFTVIYVNSVLRFVAIGIMLTTVPSTAFLEGFPIAMYTCGSMIQFYIMCACVQQLQDTVNSLTDEAFHENWYRFGSSVKRTFLLMILGTKLGCKISTNDKFTLSLSSFMLILNQSYSILLVLL